MFVKVFDKHRKYSTSGQVYECLVIKGTKSPHRDQTLLRYCAVTDLVQHFTALIHHQALDSRLRLLHGQCVD